MKDIINVQGAALAVTLSFATGLAAFFVLASVSAPRDASARALALDERAERLEAQLRPTGPQTYPKNAVCDVGAQTAVAAARNRIQAAAATSGLTLGAVSVVPGGPGEEGVTLSSVAVQFNVKGPYEGVMAMLSNLAASQPTLFVETADLTSKTSEVEFSFQGRIYCSASARL